MLSEGAASKGRLFRMNLEGLASEIRSTKSEIRNNIKMSKIQMTGTWELRMREYVNLLIPESLPVLNIGTSGF
ncbi:MAG: hypothetical protein CVU57_05995 [Deltaproteobacteria bacterium HGW-Deltaproteobacteria-15]|nr:MAG: hypothetical protein CVU57_05995 [Deltaproteobacteria bacterium HGW-Deltaproteobacteria-15]